MVIHFVQIVDRSKDVLKSGGEWISSIEVCTARRSFQIELTLVQHFFLVFLPKRSTRQAIVTHSLTAEIRRQFNECHAAIITATMEGRQVCNHIWACANRFDPCTGFCCFPGGECRERASFRGDCSCDRHTAPQMVGAPTAGHPVPTWDDFPLQGRNAAISRGAALP